MDCIFRFKLSSTHIIYYSRKSIFEQQIIDLQPSLCVSFRITQRLQARLLARGTGMAGTTIGAKFLHERAGKVYLPLESARNELAHVYSAIYE